MEHSNSPAGSDPRLEAWLADHRQELIDDVLSLVEIKSVSETARDGFPYGAGCARALDRAAALAARRGFAMENHGYHCGTITVPGKSRETIGIFCHLDVVPEGEGWQNPPYQPFVREGHIFGRGTTDNKGPAVSMLSLLQCFRDLGIRLEHTLLLYLGCSEETGMQDLEWYLEGHPAPALGLTPDASYPVCYGEKGNLSCTLTISLAESNIVRFQGGNAPNSVPDTAEILLRDADPVQARALLDGELTVETHPEGVLIRAGGVAAHAAFPEKGVSAIGKLAAALRSSELVNPAGRRVLEALAAAFATHYGDGLSIPLEDEASGRLTAVGGLLTTQDGGLRQSVNVRYPVSADRPGMIDNLKKAAQALGFGVEGLSDSPPCAIAKEHPVITLLGDVCSGVLDTALEPYVMGGGTYARKLPFAAAYGTLLRSRPRPGGATRGGGHQADECVSIQGLEDAVRVYYHALQALDGMNLSQL